MAENQKVTLITTCFCNIRLLKEPILNLRINQLPCRIIFIVLIFSLDTKHCTYLEHDMRFQSLERRMLYIVICLFTYLFMFKTSMCRIAFMKVICSEKIKIVEIPGLVRKGE